MSQCIGICQIDEFGYCIGCGRSQQQIDAAQAPADAAADTAGVDAAVDTVDAGSDAVPDAEP